MTPKIAIILTTFERDALLYKAIQSLVDNWQNCFTLIIVDQGTFSKEKYDYLSKHCVFDSLNKAKEYEATPFYLNTPIYYYKVPYNSGLSYCRNYGIQKAKELGCEYTVIGSDSFLFNSTIKWIDIYPKELGTFKFTPFDVEQNFDLIGFELDGCVCGWEAKLQLIEGQSFELDFIDKDGSDFYSMFMPLHFRIYRCDIVRNFFIATTESLLKVKWDEKLKLCEHEDFFYRYNQAGYKVGWTNIITAEKMKDRLDGYNKLRTQNFQNGQRDLKLKWGIKGWVTYKNLELAKRNIK